MRAPNLYFGYNNQEPDISNGCGVGQVSWDLEPPLKFYYEGSEALFDYPPRRIDWGPQ